MLRTGLFYLIYYPVTFVCLVIGLPLSLIDSRLLRYIAKGWARLGLWLGGVKVVVSGRQHLQPKGAAVLYIANHQSNFDIPVLLTTLPGEFGFLAKAELFRIPLFNLGMRQMKCLPIDRGKGHKAAQSLQKATDLIRAGQQVVVFPEGTRTTDGTLLPFKKGGFLLGIQAKACLIPIAIEGSWSIMPKTGWRIRPGTIHVQILPPIEAGDYTRATKGELIACVRQRIVDAMSPADPC